MSIYSDIVKMAREIWPEFSGDTCEIVDLANMYSEYRGTYARQALAWARRARHALKMMSRYNETSVEQFWNRFYKVPKECTRCMYAPCLTYDHAWADLAEYRSIQCEVNSHISNQLRSEGLSDWVYNITDD